ncbi:hypothetical protein [Phenylobacterium sp.]|uniref:hypothetical protein n=1 Tax=Phenylobacterium sp. TaxID=1871053 RepID=UPI00403508FD
MSEPITTEAFVGQLFDLWVAQGLDFDDLAAAKAAAVPIFQAWLGGDNALPAEIGRQALSVLGRTNGFVLNQYDFYTTPANGGAYGDGSFDAALPDGTVERFVGLPKLLATVPLDGFDAWKALPGNEAGTLNDYLDWLSAQQNESVAPLVAQAEAAKTVAQAKAAEAAQTVAFIVSDAQDPSYVGGLTTDGEGAIVLGVKADGSVDLEPGDYTLSRVSSALSAPIQAAVLSEVRLSQEAISPPAYVGGLVDDEGRLLYAFDPAGRMDFEPGAFALSRVGAQLAGPLASTILADVKLVGDPIVDQGFVGGLTDAEGRVLFGFDSQGRMTLTPSPDLLETIAGAAGSGPGGVAESVISSVLDENAAVLNLTGPGNVFFAQHLSADLVRFLADGEGQTRAYLQRLDIASTTAMFEAAGPLEYIAHAGQSLAVGGGAGNAPAGEEIWTTEPRHPHHCLMFNTGARGVEGGVLNPATLTDFTPLVEAYNAGGGDGETQGSGQAAWLHEIAQIAREPFRTLVFRSHGKGGTELAGLIKGTQPYANGLAEWTKAVEIAGAYGRVAICRQIDFTHGHRDRVLGTSQAAYRAALVYLLADYQADWGALNPAGSDSIVMMLDQLCAAPDGAGSVISLAQLQTAREDAGFYLVCPTYFFAMVDTVGHLIAKHYAIFGEYRARAWRRLHVEAQPWTPLWPRSAEITRTGTSLVVPFDVPEGALVLDTDTLPQATNYGFAYSGANIVDVEITAADTVTLTLDADAGGDLTYAYDGPGATGRSGAWGNLRDSSADISRVDPSFTLFNWCVIFKESIA